MNLISRLENEKQHLGEWAFKIYQGQESEKKRLALMLMNDLTQELTGIKIAVDLLRRRMVGNGVGETQLKTESLAHMIGQLRDLAEELYPSALYLEEFNQALETVCLSLSLRERVFIQFHPSRLPEMSEERKVVLVRGLKASLLALIPYCHKFEVQAEISFDRKKIDLQVIAQETPQVAWDEIVAETNFYVNEARARILILNGSMELTADPLAWKIQVPIR